MMNIGNVHSALRVHARNKPNDVAVVYYDQSLTFLELHHRVNALANSLIEIGIRKGDHVALYMRNRIEMMEILYAISTVGAVSVPINYMVEDSSLAELINKADTKYIFVETEQLIKFEKIMPQLDVINRETMIAVGAQSKDTFIQYEELMQNGSVVEPEVKVNSSDLFAILFSSGTTSSPKGIMITHEKHIYRLLRSATDFNTSSQDILLISVPIYHAVGFGYIFRPAFTGTKVVITREFEPERVLQLIEEQKISQAFFVPTQYKLLLQVPAFDQYDMTSLRLLISAGSPLSKELKGTIIEKFGCGLSEFFGSSETGSYIILHPKDVLRKMASIGQQVGHMEVRLLDDNGNNVGLDGEGEFVVRGGMLFCGYYKQSDETKNAFLPDGWFKTGDMGKVDAEGFYYLLDRKKDMIISGGVNVYPKDIEQMVSTHPAVLEVAVVGIADEKWGEAAKAYVVLKEDQEVSEEALMEYCNPQLANFQKIKELEFLSALPRNPSGKILKRELRNGQTLKIK